MAAPPYILPCDILVTYPGDIFTTKLPQLSQTDQKLLTTAVNKRKKRLEITIQTINHGPTAWFPLILVMLTPAVIAYEIGDL